MDTELATLPAKARRPRNTAVEAVERRILMSGTSAAFSTLAVGDFNSDGLSESLVRVSAGRARLADLGFVGGAFRRGALLLLDVDGALLGDPLGIRARGASPLVAVADFNSDGRLDLVLAGRRLSGARNGLTFLAGNGDGTFAAGASIGAAPSNVTSLVAGDVNGDGRADLIGTARARGNRGGDGGSFGAGRAIRFGDDQTGEKEWTIDPTGQTDFGQHRPHLVGATAEAGGATVTGSVLLPSGTGSGVSFGNSLFGDFDADITLAPGFTPPASEVGVSAEAGGARLGGFVDAFSNGVAIDDEDQVFVLFGDGAGGFSASGDSTAN